MEEDHQDLRQRPIGAKRAHLLFASVMLFAASYAIWIFGLWQ